MNVWRLILHHQPEHKEEALLWSTLKGVIGIGWGQTGDLRSRTFQSERDLRDAVAVGHPWTNAMNHMHGGRSLWRFYHEMKPRDLVILSTGGSRVQTMRVSGDYYFVGNENPLYEHRRPAEPIGIDPNALWQMAGGVARGEMIRSTLIRCAKSVLEADLNRIY
jgi:hypothetical protein